MNFAKALYVPDFENFSDRKLESAKKDHIKAKDLIDDQVLLVRLKNRTDTVTIEWTCEQLTNTSMRLLLLFEDPMQVSSMGIDTIELRFIEPDLFIHENKGSYIFDDPNQQILQSQIPPQFKTR